MVEHGRRSGRAAARRAAAALEKTPKSFPIEDEEADVEAEVEAPAEDPDDEDAADVGDEAEDGEDEGVDDVDAQQGTDAEMESGKSASPTPMMLIRRKRLGRPPKNRPADWDQLVEVPASEAEASTPRRRGRGGWRGRGGRKGQAQQVHQQPVDKDGNVMDIVDDEVELPEDPVGETKVDKNGNLLGGREYRCRTFTVAGRGDRLYMLSTEPARCVGFRDSYLFFTKHRRLYKIIIGDDEKRDMIEREIIPHSYKGRSIGIVTARSVFREFGALIVVGGRRITDDYDMAKAREEGAVEGAIADPNDHFVPGEPYNKNQYVAWHGASAVYHSSAPVVPQQSMKLAESKKRRVAVNDSNWQLEHAREASHYNSTLTAARKATLGGVYDIHTNMMQYPAIMQPMRARAVQVLPWEEEAAATAAFPALAPQVARNFTVADVCLQTPAVGVSSAAYERFRSMDADGEAQDFLSPFRGLGAVSDEIRDLLPAECRAAFDRARGNEQEWFQQWGDEKDTMCRREPVIDKAIVPSSMLL